MPGPAPAASGPSHLVPRTPQALSLPPPARVTPKRVHERVPLGVGKRPWRRRREGKGGAGESESEGEGVALSRGRHRREPKLGRRGGPAARVSHSSVPLQRREWPGQRACRAHLQPRGPDTVQLGEVYGTRERCVFLLLRAQPPPLAHPLVPLQKCRTLHCLPHSMALRLPVQLGATSARALSLGPSHLSRCVPTSPIQHLSPGWGALRIGWAHSENVIGGEGGRGSKAVAVAAAIAVAAPERGATGG